MRTRVASAQAMAAAAAAANQVRIPHLEAIKLLVVSICA